MTKIIYTFLISLIYSASINCGYSQAVSNQSKSYIIDNKSAGFITSGRWTISSAVSGYIGENYLHDGDEAANPDAATWHSPIKTEGTYNVYMRWTSAANRPDAAPVEINYFGGIAHLTINQKENGGKWVKIGTWKFTGNSGDYVKIMASDQGYTIADGVKWELTEDIALPCIFNADFKTEKISNCTFAFTDKSTGSELNPIGRWFWDFGDGSIISREQNPIHTYVTPGNYLVTLVIAPKNTPMYCEALKSDSVFADCSLPPCNVKVDFEASIDIIESTRQCEVYFNTTNVLNGTTITEWLWDLGDGSPTVEAHSFQYAYASNGTYQVCLKAKGTNGETACDTTICRQLILNCPFTSGSNVNSPESQVTLSEATNGSSELTAAALNDIIIQPNPTNGITKFRFYASQAGSAQIQVFNQRGEEKLSVTKIVSAGLNDLEINVDNLSRGVHSVRIMLGNKIMVQKLIKN